jgi:hypothetical protein
MSLDLLFRDPGGPCPDHRAAPPTTKADSRARRVWAAHDICPSHDPHSLLRGTRPRPA